MSVITPVTGAALVRRRVSGVAFLLVISSLVWLTTLLYQKAFTPVVRVTLQADRIGNQLSPQADVKLRGIVVGTVRSVRSTGDGATISLALDPGQIRLIPQNVLARLVPKTLFGEKYVELVLPTTSVGRLKAGDVIPQDRSATALETERVLDDLLPLLQSLRPAQVSLTLNALSTALRGRGNKLGANLALTGAYLKKLNPSVPTLGRDLGDLGAVSSNIADVAPALLTTLDNLAASSRNLVSERPQLDTFLAKTGAFATSAESIVRQNERNLTLLARDSLPVLNLFARYSPEFPCLLKGLANYEPIVAKTFGGLQPGLHITVEGTLDDGGFRPGQEPKYREKRAPSCWGLPHPHVPEGDDKFDDGYQSSTTPSPASALLARNPALAAVASPALGIPADQVPDVVGLLLGPLAEGNTVGLS
jgi:phospholipid/cholesterol/gamma-HCH transport system substrate-binding protein